MGGEVSIVFDWVCGYQTHRGLLGACGPSCTLGGDELRSRMRNTGAMCLKGETLTRSAVAHDTRVSPMPVRLPASNSHGNKNVLSALLVSYFGALDQIGGGHILSGLAPVKVAVAIINREAN